MRHRDAWLAAIAAALGLSEEACRRDAAQVQQVATVASSSAVVAATAPSASAEIAPSASVAASAAPSASASVVVVKPPATSQTANLQELSQAICGAVPQNIQPLQNTIAGPTVIVTVALTGGAAGDDHTTAALRPRMRACANQALAQDPTQQGKILVVAAIGPNGEVTKADVAMNQGLTANAAQCMARGVRNAQFAAGAARTVQLVINVTKSP